MKRVISVLLLITLLLASVIAMIPASAATPTEFNLMGDSDKNKQWAGEGNVFYYDYHKYLDLKNTFPVTDYGNLDYMIRLPNAGEGSASVSDGVKTSGGVNHTPDATETREINGRNYNQYFGYSFKESVVADAITLYLPASTVVTQIDVYGGCLDKDNKIFAKEAEKTLLASFENVSSTQTTAVEGADLIVLQSELYEAFKLDYIYFAIKVSTRADYLIYEIELNGILASDAADFSALKAEYANYSELIEDDWTVDTWANLKNALTTTDPINKNATSTATEIASAAATLKTAINGLKAKPADKTALASAIAEAAELVEEEYTPDSWAKFEDALSAARVINGMDGVSQTEINDALAALNEAIDALQAPADKSDLEAAIAELDDLNESDYTPASWEALQTPIAKAAAVKNNVSATQQEVDEALAALTMAINALAKPGNKTALKSAITSAKALKRADYNVLAVTWNVFQTCIEEAEAVVADANATQGDIDLALENLNEKIKGLGEPAKNNNNNNNTDDEDEDLEDEEDEDTEDEETLAPVPQTPATQAPIVQPAPAKKGCGSSVALSALAIVGAIGTALVIKKKD